MAVDSIQTFQAAMRVQDKVGTLELSVVSLTVGERQRNALRWLGICWGLALASIPIALAHFILVPGFLIGGLVMAWRKYGEANQIMRQNAKCAYCDSPIEIAARPETWPFEVTCPNCRNILTIKKTAI